MNTPAIDHRVCERRADWHTPSDCPNYKSNETAMQEINKRLDDGSARMGRIETSVEEVKATLAASEASTAEHRKKSEAQWQENTEATQEILEIASALKGFIKIVKIIGKLIGWAAAIAAPLVAIWYTIHPSSGPK